MAIDIHAESRDKRFPFTAWNFINYALLECKNLVHTERFDSCHNDLRIDKAHWDIEDGFVVQLGDDRYRVRLKAELLPKVESE